MSETKGPCPHGRPDWRMCPHCNGINESPFANVLDGMLPEPRKTVPFGDYSVQLTDPSISLGTTTVTKADLDKHETESPCFRAIIEEDWVEQLRQSQRQDAREMFQMIEARSARLEDLVAIYKMYYDDSERIDRQYPHYQSKHKRGGTVPILNHALSRQHHMRIRNRIDYRKEQIGHIEAGDDEELKWAASEGLRQHEESLEPCKCTNCFRG